MNITQLNNALNTLREVASVAYGKKSGEETNGGAGNIGMIGGKPIKFNTKFGERTLFGRADADTREHMKVSCDELRAKLQGIITNLLGGYNGAEAMALRRSLGVNGDLLKRTTVATTVELIYMALKQQYGNEFKEAFGGSDTIWTDAVRNRAVRTQDGGSITPFKNRWAFVHQEQRPVGISLVGENTTNKQDLSAQNPKIVSNLLFQESKTTTGGGLTPTPGGNTLFETPTSTPGGNTLFETPTSTPGGNTLFETPTPGGESLFEENTPQFVDINQPVSLKELEDRISRNEMFKNIKVSKGQESNYLFAEYLLNFRPGVENFNGSIDRFLDRVGERLDLSARVNKWAGTNAFDARSFKKNLFNCFASSPQHPLFTNAKYDMLFSSGDSETEETEKLIDEFVKDLDDLMTKKESKRPLKAGVKISTPPSKKNTLDEQQLKYDMEQANKKSRERIQEQINKAEVNAGKRTTYNVNAVSDVYEASGLKEKPKTKVKIEPPRPDPKVVIKNEWDQIEKTWKVPFEKILDDVQLKNWKDTTGHQDVEGFKALMMCLISKDVNFMSSIQNSSSKRESLVRLQSEFETVFNKLEIDGKCASRRQKIGEFVYERVRNLPKDNTVSNMVTSLLNGKMGDLEKGMDNFRDALNKALVV